MAYNNGFPMTYQQMYPQYGYQQPVQYQQPSSRMVEVYPIDDEKVVDNFPVNNGNTAMLIAKDDGFIAVKTVGLDGTVSEIFYDKRPPAPPVPSFDPGRYVTRDELEKRLAALQMAPGEKEEAVG